MFAFEKFFVLYILSVILLLNHDEIIIAFAIEHFDPGSDGNESLWGKLDFAEGANAFLQVSSEDHRNDPVPTDNG